ncbi:MAG: replicative DNA helicase [Actinomycetota bacterium]|nr:replicative DNA helicase [Actinomycetota bacterium]
MRSVETGSEATRVPPHDLEAERAVIGAMLVSETAVAAVAERLDARDFYSEVHRIIYGAMMRLYSRGDPIDQLTLTNELRSVDEFERVGGRPYVFQIVESVPTAANAGRYAEIVRGKALLRAVIDVGSRITEEAFREPENVSEALDSAEQLIYGVSNQTLREHLAPVSELAPGALEMIQRLYEQEGEVTGVETGFEDLDRLTTGFHKSDLVILAARPAMGKCLGADAEIVLDDGSVRTIEEIYQEQKARLMTLGGDMKLSWTRPSAFIDDGVKPVYEVKTRLGRAIKTTLTHPFLTVNGWRRLGDLSVGDHVAVPRRMPVFGSEPLGTHRIKLLAYMLGDGNMTGSTPRFTNADPLVRHDFAMAVEEFGGLRARTETSGGARTPTLCVRSDRGAVRRPRHDFARTLRTAVLESGCPARELAGLARVSPASLTNWSLGRTVPDAATALRLRGVLSESSVALDVSGLDLARKNVPNALRRWLEALGLWGRAAAEKFVPDAVFRAPREEVALFLNRLFATDGWATVLSSGQAQLGYCSASERLARQVQHLLLRFGVISSLRERSVKYGASRRRAFQLDITGGPSIRAFGREIGIFSKEEATERASDAVENRRPHDNRDLIPREVWKLIDEARGTESWASLARRMGHGPGHNLHVGTRDISREHLRRFAQVLDDQRLQDLADSDVYWDRIVSIEPLGPGQVYDLTVPGTHNFVANDVCVHNTALALNAIWHAAGERNMPVAIFSLEMSKEQLVQRLISQTTRIPAQALRSGNVKAEDWPKLVRGVAKVSQAPIWIDDTAGVTLMEIRAKVRRLSSQLNVREETPLSLVVIDYLQLMIGQGNRQENRQQEVAEISRGLKVLARDLDVPVLAIAQLSRAVEARHDKRPLLSDLRDSGCLPASTRITRADNGGEVALGELVLSQQQPYVWSVNDQYRLVPARLTRAFPTGIKPVYRLKLASGLEVDATANHPFLTVEGWARLDSLAVDGFVAVPRRLPRPVEEGAGWTDDELVLLAHLLGDGSIGPSGVKYATADPTNKEAVEEAARTLFGIEALSETRGNTHQVWLPSPYRLTHGKRHPVREWLEPHGLWGTRSWNKFIPETIFGLDDQKLALFLRHLWSTDGSITVSRNGRGPTVTTYYSSTSRRLVLDVKRMLLRFGVRSAFGKTTKKRGGGTGSYRPSYNLRIQGAEDQRRFLLRVGCHGGRGEKIGPALKILSSFKANPNVDLVPWEVRRKVVGAMAEMGVGGRELAAAIGETYNGGYLLGTPERRRRFSRPRLARMASVLESEELADIARSDLFWDRIVEITPLGEQPTFDVTVEGTHNFIADGVVVHNSIEQDADMVMFLYRDEYYNPDSDDKGIAEVIVGKHRNGPTGKVQLAWMEQYTKFASLARRT